MIHQGTPAAGHFTGMATRSLHARGAGALRDTFRMAEVARRGARIVRRRAARLERVSLATPLARFTAKGINLGVEVI